MVAKEKGSSWRVKRKQHVRLQIPGINAGDVRGQPFLKSNPVEQKANLHSQLLDSEGKTSMACSLQLDNLLLSLSLGFG